MKKLVLTALLSACTAAEPPMEMITPEISACDLPRLQAYIGGKRDVLSGVIFNVPVRWIPEGGMMTMDYFADRINFELDGNDVITRVFCG